MPQLKIGVQLNGLHLPLRKALLAAKRLGAAAVEIDARGEINPGELSETGIRQLKKQLDDLDLRVAAVAFRTRRGYGLPDELDRRVEATKIALRFARAVGAEIVVNQVGRVPARSEGREWDLLVQVLSDLGAFGDRVGARLSAETGSESGADLRRLIEGLPPGSIGVTLNPGNLIINGFSPLDFVNELGSAIHYVHAKDGIRDLAQGRGVEVPLGRGAADFPALLGALGERSYRGYWTIERERVEDPMHEISQAISFLQSI